MYQTELGVIMDLCFEIESFHAAEADFKIAVALLLECWDYGLELSCKALCLSAVKNSLLL